MKLTTPVNGIKNGEMYAIRDVYAKMINESANKANEDALFKNIYETVKSNDFEKLSRFAAKNRTLCESATCKAINKACKSVDCDKQTLESVHSKVKAAIERDLAPFCAKCTDCMRKKVNEAGRSLDDIVNNGPRGNVNKDEPSYRDDDDDGELTRDEIDMVNDLTKDIKFDSELTDDKLKDNKEKNGDGIDYTSANGEYDTHTKDARPSKSDADDDEDTEVNYDKDRGEDDDVGSTTELKDKTFRGNFDNTSDRETAYDDDDDDESYDTGYCVNRIIAGIFVNGKIVGHSAIMYDNVDAKVGNYSELFNDMHDVMWFVSKKTGINFGEKEFTVKFSSVETIKIGNKTIKSTPPIVAGTTITSKMVQGNKVLNRVFGPDGRYAGYLYNDDGTPRIEPNDSAVDGMTDAEKDVAVIDKYPMLQVAAFVQKVVHDDDGEQVKEEITPKDFEGTKVNIEA